MGAVLLLGGARAAGAALVGSSACSFLAFLLSRLYGGDHLETLVHGAVILGSVGLVGFGLAGLASGADHPLGRSPMALALGAFGTVVVGTLLILRIHAEAAPSCSLSTGLRVTNSSSPFAASCFRGFEDPWLQALLAFNVAFLALLFLVQAWQAMRSSGKQEQEDGTMSAAWRRLIGLPARGGTPFLLQVPSPGADARSHARRPGMRRLWAVLGTTSILIAACTSTPTGDQSNRATAACFDAAKVKGLHDEFEHKAGDADLSDGMDMDRVVASLRATREIALELALATAADPVAAGHFKDAAEAYLKAPPIPPHVSLDEKTRNDIDIDRLEKAKSEGGNAFSAGIEALNNSPIPFC